MLTLSKVRLFLLLLIITSFYSLWSLELNNFDTRLLILILLIPILTKFFKKRNFAQKANYLFKYKFAFYFLIINYFFIFLSSYLNDSNIKDYQVFSNFFMFLIFVIHLNFRKLFERYFKLFLKMYFYLFFIGIFFGLFFSKLDNNCTVFYELALRLNLLDYFRNNNLGLHNFFYSENSHFGMLFSAILFSYLLFFYKKKERKKNRLFHIFVLFSLMFSSTTMLLSFFIILIFCFIFYKIDKSNIPILIILGSIFLILFFSSPTCSKKILDFNVSQMNTNSINKIDLEVKNMTTSIYERSFAITFYSFRENLVTGVGFNNYEFLSKKILNKHQFNTDKKFINDPKLIQQTITDYFYLNLQDGLGNFFKITVEYGYLSILIFGLIAFYVIFQKKNHIHIFFSSILLIQLCRGAGYFNGGFCFAIFEVIIFIFNRKFKDSFLCFYNRQSPSK